MGQTKRFDLQLHCSGIRRNSQLWEDIRYRLLKETVVAIDKFGVKATVIIDTNDISCEGPIRRELGESLTNVELKVVEHLNLKHGYMLSTVHRESMSSQISEFDYFMYTEDDVLVPPEGLEYIHRHWKTLYKTGKIPTFMRVVMDPEGQIRYITHTPDKFG